jgi:hypothetical protein
MVKSKIVDKLRNNIKEGLKRFQNERVQDQIFQISSLLSGILIALALNFSLPYPPTLFLFCFLLVMVFALGVFAWLTEYFFLLRILLIGASIVSVLSALLTWISTGVSTGEVSYVSIDDNQIDGIFRSILLTSFFSLLERTTRFIEDRVAVKERTSKITIS